MANKNENTEVVESKQELTQGQRFVSMVTKEFGTNIDAPALTDFQKRLAQNYFVVIDAVLQKAEQGRLAKSAKYQDSTPVTWASVNLDKLAKDVVTYARIGLDPAQPNHINPIPFKNKSTGKYDITFIEGYRGLELKATKYGLDIPDAVVIEVLYSTDEFKLIKRDRDNPGDSYTLNITNPFNRGEVVGGFYYHIYNDNPNKNKLVVFNKKDIEKRKPTYASPEFWGGEKDKWEDGKKVGKEKVEGWYDEMVRKTIHRAAYRDIAIDSQKIDDDYMRLKEIELESKELMVEAEIEEKANTEFIDIQPNEPEPVEVETVEQDDLKKDMQESLEDVELVQGELV